jgi:hypothetical protein
LANFAVASPASSQTDSEGFAKEGGFAGVTFVPQFTFDGVTFDGQSGYKEVGGDEVVFLPKVDKQNVMRPVLGYRGRKGSLLTCDVLVDGDLGLPAGTNELASPDRP